MMTALIIGIHVFACIALICIVLLQAGKGAEMGVSFGGGASQALLGGSGDTPMIGKITTAIAVIFMLTSLTLAYMSGHQKSKSVMDKPIPVQSKTQTSETPEAKDAPAAAPKAEATAKEAPAPTAPAQPEKSAPATGDTGKK